MSRRLPDDAHSLGPREAEVMDLFDGGMGSVAIAAELNLNPAYVGKVIALYSGSWVENNAFDAMVRAGSIALAGAIARTGKVFS